MTWRAAKVLTALLPMPLLELCRPLPWRARLRNARSSMRVFKLDGVGKPWPPTRPVPPCDPAGHTWAWVGNGPKVGEPCYCGRARWGQRWVA